MRKSYFNGFLHQADRYTNLPRFQGARPNHVQVQSSRCCFPWASLSFDQWHVTRSPPIRKRIWVGRYSNDDSNAFHNVTQAKETITCRNATCLSTQHWLVCCTNKLKYFGLCFDYLKYCWKCFYSIPHFHSFTSIWLKTSNFKSSWSLNRSIKQNKITLVKARDWPRPLNRGGHWIKFLFQCITEMECSLILNC